MSTATIEHGPDVVARCQHLFENSPQPLAAVEGEEHTVLYLNPAFSRLVGKEQSELIGHPFSEAAPNGGINLLPLLTRVYQTGLPQSSIEQDHSQTPPVFWSYTVWAIAGEEEHPAGLMIQMTDVTETAIFRDQAAAMNESLMISSVRQHELTETEEKLNTRLQLLLDALPVGVIIAEDPEARIISLNPAGTRMFEIPEEENIPASALSAHRYFHEGRGLTPEEIPLMMAVSGNQDVHDMEIDVHLSSGKHWTGIFNATPLHGPEEKIVGAISVRRKSAPCN